MKSAIAVLTYRRLSVLQETLRGIRKHSAQYPLAIFEDCGQRDGTEAFLQRNAELKANRPEMMADEWVPAKVELSEEEALLGITPERGYHSFQGTRNVGVAANSNKALKWFMEETDADHLCLCNDDLHVLGDFVAAYAEAHEDLGVGLFCFCDFLAPTYKWATTYSRGHRLRLMPRFTGIMMSLTRKVVEDIGYFDDRFGQFGEEHCDYTIRARFAGHINLDGVMQNCLDINPDPPVLKSQEGIVTSVVGEARKKADAYASMVMGQCSMEYNSTHYYRDYGLGRPFFAANWGESGIPTKNLPGYKLVPVGA